MGDKLEDIALSFFWMLAIIFSVLAGIYMIVMIGVLVAITPDIWCHYGIFCGGG